ncbi:MAG: hypothetical protein ACRC4X_01620 [Cetobacterium sp.]
MKRFYYKKLIRKYNYENLEEEYEVVQSLDDDDFIKHGYCKKYDSYGRLELESYYENGVLNGDYKKYCYGDLKEIGRYISGLKEGKWIEYSEEQNYIKGEIQKKIIKNETENKINKSIFLNSLGKLFTGCIIGILLILAILIFKVQTSSTNEPKDLLLQHEQTLENKTSNTPLTLGLKYE